MSRDPALYLGDIVEACRRIERMAAGRSDDQVFDDEVVRDAILFNIVVIGEAAASLPADAQARFPGIQWGRIKAMRNMVAHEYFGLDRFLVLDVVRLKVPELRRTIEPTLPPV
jgi:uncharacterized protein with HEPN domain